MKADLAAALQAPPSAPPDLGQFVDRALDDLSPARVLRLFKRVPARDVPLLGLAGRPEHLLITVLAVPPVRGRPCPQLQPSVLRCSTLLLLLSQQRGRCAASSACPPATCLCLASPAGPSTCSSPCLLCPRCAARCFVLRLRPSVCCNCGPLFFGARSRCCCRVHGVCAAPLCFCHCSPLFLQLQPTVSAVAATMPSPLVQVCLRPSVDVP